MKSLLVRVLAASLGLCAAKASAQVLLQDFSNFVVTDQTYFVGGWSAGDDVTPAASFFQDSGLYAIVNGTNADTAYVDFYFSSSLDLSGFTSLALTAVRTAGNTAPSLSVSLLDSAMNVATAVFDLGSYSLGTSSTLTRSVLPGMGFNGADVIGFRITGADFLASGVVDLGLDELRATSGLTPVPEAATFAWGAAALILCAMFGRQRSRRGSKAIE